MQKMSRHMHLASQGRRENKYTINNSQQLTVNVTLKDLNREARGILRKSMLKDNLKKPRNEFEVYVSGPWFPCQDYKLKRGSLRKNSVAFDTKDTRTGSHSNGVENDLERHILDSKNDQYVKKLTNDLTITEDTEKNGKPSITPNARFSQKEQKVSFEDDYKEKTKRETECEHTTCLASSSTRPPMLHVDSCATNHKIAKRQAGVELTQETKDVESCVSSASKSMVRISDSENINDGRILTTEKRPSLDVMVEENSLKETEQSQVGPEYSPVWKTNECSREMKIPTLSVSDLTDEKGSSKLSEEEFVTTTSTIEGCLQTLQQEIKNDEFENTKLLEGKINQLPSSASYRRSSSQLDPKSSRATSPLFERREKRLSNVSNVNSTSTKFLKNNHTSSGQSYLENISNPLLRESLNKILNPQSYMEDFEATPSGDEITVTMKLGGTLFEEEQEFSLPNIKGNLKYSSLDVGDPRKRSSRTNNNYKTKSTVRVTENKRSPVLSSTKCPGIVVHRIHPVRMLSVDSEYAVKGLIGQWLKRRSGNTLARDKASVEKQETYREVQLLKVGLSMRLLAGIG